MSEIISALPRDFYLTFKPHLFAKKSMWQQLLVKDAMLFVSKIEKTTLENGCAGIWLKPILTNFNNTKYYWLLLDVESQDHNDVKMNLEAGKNFLYWLGEMNLTKGLKIMLSGRGLRFIWPYIVPPKYNKAFMLWISDRKHFPIDNSPQCNSSFFRFLAYRGNRKQDRNPKDIHTHLLPNFNDIWFLTEEDYLNLVSGKISAETYLSWIASDLLPNDYASKSWIELLEIYERKRILKGSIFQQGYIKRPISKNYKQTMLQIEEYLNKSGKEMREIQTGGLTIWKISGGCPSCGRTDGNPYVTSSGRLKCWHANSCPAGERTVDGKIEGLSPFQWIEGFHCDDDLDFNEDSRIETITVQDAHGIISKALKSDSDILLKSTPGSGKTTMTLKRLICAAKDCEKIIHRTD